MALEEVVVVVECVGCKARRKIRAGEVADDDVPMCKECFMPMVPIRAEAR